MIRRKLDKEATNVAISPPRVWDHIQVTPNITSH